MFRYFLLFLSALYLTKGVCSTITTRKAGSQNRFPINRACTSSVTVYNHLKKIMEKIGLKDVRFHDLRHSFAAISLQNGDDIKTVSENLGHATVAFTLDVYGHVTEKMKKDSADRMQAFIQSL